MSSKDPAFKVGSPAGYEDVSSVRKGKDDHEAVLTFDKPYASWRALFGAPNNTPLYPAKYMADARASPPGTSTRSRSPQGRTSSPASTRPRRP